MKKSGMRERERKKERVYITCDQWMDEYESMGGE